MDFKEQIKRLSERINKLKEQISTEEATKNAFVMPFLTALGYDVFNPFEVVPEYVADIGVKKGEKVDYALLKDGQPVMLVECKHWSQKLENNHSQLMRYFHVTKVRFAILTNGIKYRFYSDLVETNIMDAKPFFECDMNDLKDFAIAEIFKFHKSQFDVATILSAANELKYVSEIRNILTQELKSPSDEFVKLFASKVYNRKMTANVLVQFSELVKKSAQQLIQEMVAEQLPIAPAKASEKIENQLVSDKESKSKTQFVSTTPLELEGFFVVKSILRPLVDDARLAYRDAQAYCAILLDDNNRKTICRLYFNSTKKYIALMDASKKEIKIEIKHLDEIYAHTHALTATTNLYLNADAASE
jgi:hypothetical protein